MVAGMTADQLNTWNYDFLKDLGVTNYATQARDLGFLGAWENRENIGNLAMYNPLGTTMGGFGGQTIPGSSQAAQAGVKLYPDIASGAQANAQALMGSNPGYAELLGAFQQGTLDQSNNYLGLSTWSNAGYSNLSGLSSVPGSGAGGGSASGGNPFVASGANNVGLDQQRIQAGGLLGDIGLTKAQEAIDENYARSEAAFQQQLLGLQKETLGNQQQTLARQLAEAPIFQGEIMKQFMLQFAGIAAAGQDTNRQYRQSLTDLASTGAATGASFTKGARDQHANTMADWASATHALQREKQNLASKQFEEETQYMEQIAQYQDAKKQLDIIGQRYNISGEEIASRLGYSLQQLQSGMNINIADLFTQLMTSQAGVPALYNAPAMGALTQSGVPAGTSDQTTSGGVYQNPNVPIAGIGGGG